jgi:hypothetical protein
MFMYLRQCVQQQYLGAMNISSLDEYSAVSFILGFNLERTPKDSAFSGISLMAGQTVTLVLNHILPPGNPPAVQLQNNANASLTSCYLTFVYDAVLDITGAGCSVQQ